ncbi:nucleoside transporter [Bacteroidia bacterium]|nr:nucleoside transporter [Bacteroidia bacterium]
MAEWINNNWIEVTGAVLALVYLILEIKRKWTLWIACIISSSFYVYIFFDAKLYAEMGLNLYYVIMSVYGLYCWKLAKEKDNEENKFHHISVKTIIPLTCSAILIWGIMLLILIQFTDSDVPIPDALIASLSIIATWMVAKKIVECWYLWIFVDAFATGLYVYQKLYPTAILFVCYTLLSIVGLIEWRKSVIGKK